MADGLPIRTDVASPIELRRFAKKERRRRTAQRMLAIANALEGMSRADAARAVGMARQRFFDEEMTFRPAHSLAAHRPLGSVMRARLQVYAAFSDFRHRENGIAAVEPARIEDVPG